MNKARLQVALDFVELARAMKVAEQAVSAGARCIEAGTPLIKSEGLDAVRALRAAFGDRTIIADMKTMDAGRIETEAAAKAGANVITVLGAAPESTIRECVEAGLHYGMEVAVDLLGVSDPVAFARRARELGVAWLDVHCGIDSQMQGEDPLELLKQIRAVWDGTLAVAGGLNSETAALAVGAGADVVIVGGAITKAEDVAGATADILKAMESGNAVASELFKRVSAENVREALEAVRTPNISMAMHNAPSLRGLHQITPGARAVGRAVTVRTAPGDWAKPVEAIDVAEPGDIIVVDAAGQGPAIWGELATWSCKNKGVAGLVVHGAVRDTDGIREVGLPVWATLVTADAGEPKGVGIINEPVTITGQRICPGDWIVGDEDGVMAIPQARAVEIANRSADVLEAENRIRREIQAGSTLAQVVNLKRWEKRGDEPIIG